MSSGDEMSGPKKKVGVKILSGGTSGLLVADVLIQKFLDLYDNSQLDLDMLRELEKLYDASEKGLLGTMEVVSVYDKNKRS